jgi:hypothetical protein
MFFLPGRFSLPHFFCTIITIIIYVTGFSQIPVLFNKKKGTAVAEYHLLSTWDLEAPIQTVWDAIFDTASYSSWWKYVGSVTEIEPNLPGGIGGLYRYHWKTALPYSLSFNVRVSQNQPLHTLEGTAQGELNGVGCWELAQMDGFTRVTYDWRVQTSQAWMNLLAPIAGPVFIWNHKTVMADGGRSLAKRLGVKLLANRHQTL